MTQLTFDPRNTQERTDVLKMLKGLDPRPFESSTSSNSQSTSSAYSGAQDLFNQITELKKQVSALTKEKDVLDRKCKEHEQSIKRYSNDVEKSTKALGEKEEEINQLKRSVDHLNNEIHNREEKIKETEQTYETMIADSDKEHKNAIEKKEAEIKQLQDDFDKTQRKLEEQIKSLKEKLAAFIPDDVVDGQVIRFNIDQKGLVQTGLQNAPYIAQVASDGNVVYHFNVEKGPVIRACQEQELMLKPYCDIEHDDGDGASEIRMVRYGKAKLSGGAQKTIVAEDIIEKAIIKIVRS